jgi:hypothetical protein
MIELLLKIVVVELAIIIWMLIKPYRERRTAQKEYDNRENAYERETRLKRNAWMDGKNE